MNYEEFLKYFGTLKGVARLPYTKSTENPPNKNHDYRRIFTKEEFEEDQKTNMNAYTISAGNPKCRYCGSDLIVGPGKFGPYDTDKLALCANEKCKNGIGIGATDEEAIRDYNREK